MRARVLAEFESGGGLLFKIDIAKDVIEDLLKTLDPKLELGLMANGHRRKGDCADIELMITPGEFDRAKFLETVQSINPKGKTPLTDSVEAAAKFLQQDSRQFRHHRH